MKKELIKCKRCKKEFEPFKRNDIIISRYCSSCLFFKAKKKEVEQWKSDKKKLKNKLKTHKDYLKEAQFEFNKFIRLRDKKKGCISCGANLEGTKYDASHYFSVGAYPNLRFHVNNVAAACVHCNQHLGGNIHEYRIGLINRIGIKKVEALEAIRNNARKYTIVELIELKEYYKEKNKEL